MHNSSLTLFIEVSITDTGPAISLTIIRKRRVKMMMCRRNTAEGSMEVVSGSEVVLQF